MHDHANDNARVLLNLVRRDAIQALGAHAATSTQLGNAALALVRRQGLEPSPHTLGFAAKELCERAVARCAPNDNDSNANVNADTHALRGYTLLRAFYVEKKTRRDTLRLMHLAGNSAFDATRARALSQFAQALEQVCQEFLGQTTGAVPSSSQAGVLVPESWLAAATARKGRNIPARLFRVLYGREREVERLTSWLTEQDGAPLICVTGIGGNGKTALAHEAAERSLAFFADVLWVSAKQRDWLDGREYRRHGDALTFDRLMDSLVSQTRLAGINLHSTAERRAALKALFADHAFLIVLDNLEDSDDEIDITLRMLDLLGRSRLLITTRSRFVEDLPVARECPVSGLSVAEAARYLRSESAHQHIAQLELASDAVIAEIHALTGGAPLALNLVIGQARTWPIPVVLERLRRAVGTPRSFYQYLFAQGWRALDDAARRVWVFLARAMPAFVSREQLNRCRVVEEARFDLAIESLMRLQIIERDASPMASESRISLHPLARQFAQQAPSMFELEPALAEFHRAGCIALAAQGWIEVARQEPAVFDQEPERTNALFSARAAAELGFDDWVVRLWRVMSQSLYEAGFWRDHVQLSELALAAARRVHDVAAEAEICGDLGWMLGELNCFDEATPLVQSALERYASLGDVAGQVRMWRYLATLAVMQGELASARLQLEALRDAIVHELHAVDAPHYAALARQLVPVHGSLGAVCRELDDEDCADRELTQALEKAPLFSKRSRSNALLNLSKLRFQQGRLDDAKTLLSECLGLSIEGGFRDIAAEALLDLAKVAQRHNDLDTARRLAMDSAKLYQAIGANDRADAAKALFNL
jgi:hypothetical protein